MDAYRLLGWDVYTFANHSIAPAAQRCIEGRLEFTLLTVLSIIQSEFHAYMHAGAQAALYQLHESEVLTFSNCAKLAQANITNHNDCQCYAARDRQGR